jgi:L-cysteine desulfidase
VSEDGTSGTEFYGCVKPGCSSDYTSQVDACGAGGYSAIQTRTTFCFVAFGQIDTDPAIDVWTINMNGALNNGANDECAVKIEGLCARSYTARGGNDVDLLAN